MAAKHRAQTHHATTAMIAGGETPDHVYAGIAVAQEILRRTPEAALMFVGAPDSLEASIIPASGFEFTALDVPTPEKFGNRVTMPFLRSLPRAVSRAMRVVKTHTPRVILGVGGYVSVPVLYAAYLLRIPTMLFEASRHPALANRLLCRSVNTIAVGFEESRALLPSKNIRVTGHPVRREFLVLSEIPPPDKGRKLNFLVLSSGPGARNLNYTTIAALDYLAPYRGKLTFTHQSGQADFDYVQAGYKKRGFKAHVIAQTADLPKLYAKSHAIISHAGTNAISEILVSGRSAILVPYPRDDADQDGNATALRDRGIAQMIAPDEFSGTTLSQAIQHLADHPEALAQVWPTGRRQPAEQAAGQLAEACLRLAFGPGWPNLDMTA